MITASEKYVYIIDQVTPFNTQCIIKLRGKLTIDVFLKALELTQQQHPHLGVTFNESTPPSLVKCLQPLPYKVIKNSGRKAQWKKIAAEEINSFFHTPGLPLGRVVFIQGKLTHKIIFTINHIIADGISICHLGRSFYKYCVDIIDGIPIDITPYQELSLEELIPNYVTTTGETEDDFKEKNKKSVGDPNHAYPQQCETLFITHRFTQEETQKIIQTPKEHHLSVHAMLSAAAITALNEHILQEKKDTHCCKTQYISPINLRPMLAQSVAPEELGHYIGCYLGAFSKSQINSFWNFARLIKKSLVTFINNREPLKYILGQANLLAKYATPMQLVNHIRWKGPVVGVSNVGQFAPIERSSLKLESLHPVTCMPAVWNFPFSYMVVVSTIQNRMQIDVMYTSPTISQAQARRYLKLLCENIEKYALSSDLISTEIEAANETSNYLEVSRRHFTRGSIRA